MRIKTKEFLALNLRAHALLHDVPLEDIWAIPLLGGGAGRTVADVREAFAAGVRNAPAAVRGLFRLRWRIGSLLGWDRQRAEWAAESFASRLSEADLRQSLVPPGTPDGKLKLLYRFPAEQLGELRNGTVHAFGSLSVREAPGGYLAHLAIYVRPVHRLTPLYMCIIAPFRRLMVYPAIIRKTQAAWTQRYGGVRTAAGR